MFREIYWQDYLQGNLKQKLKVYTDTDKHGHTEVITDFHIKFQGKSLQDLLMVRVDGGVESCILSLRAYRRMFPNNLTTNGLTKYDALQSVSHIILESSTDGILPVY